MASQYGETTDSTSIDRRSLLRQTGATTVAGALTALAGCGGSGGGDDAAGSDDGMEPVPTVNFVTWTQNQKPGYFEMTRMMVEQFEQLGISIELDPQQYPQPFISTLFETRDFDMLMLGMEGASYRLDPGFYLNTALHSDNVDQGGWNLTGFEREEFDSLSREQQRALNQEDRRELVYELQQLQRDQQAWTVFQYPMLASGLDTASFEEPSQTVPGEGFSSMWTLVTIDGGAELDYGKAQSNINSLNPLNAQSADDIQFIEPLYDTITRIGPNGRAENWLATDVVVEDDTTVTVTLRDGVTFHDDEEVTGEDVAFSFRYQQENNAPYVSSYLEPVGEASADGQRVTFSLSRPYAPFTTLTLGQVPILPKHIWDGVADREDVEDPANYRNEPPIGSGPFEFAEYRDGSYLELAAVDDHPFAPAIDTLRFRLYGTKSTAQQALQRGEIDVLDQLPNTLRRDIERSDDLLLNFQPQHGLRALLHNTRNGQPYSDPAFRRALAHAIPRGRIRDQVYGGRAGLGGSIIAEANEFWHNPDVEPLAFDTETARSVLSEAGYTWSDDGRLHYPTE